MQAHTVLSTSSTGHGSLCRVGVPRHRQAFGAAPCRQQRKSGTPIRAQGSVAPCEMIEAQLPLLFIQAEQVKHKLMPKKERLTPTSQ